MNNPYIIDGHCDSLIHFVDGERTLQDPSEGGQWDTRRALRAGVSLQFLAAFIETEYKPARSTSRGLQLIEGAQRFIADYSDQVFLVLGKSDLTRIPDRERIGILLSVEGGEILGQNLFMLDKIYQLGVRALGLTWNQRNALADGVGVPQSQNRLTRLGQEVVLRMNELGMLIDVSHLNEAGFWHVLELSKSPIAASHSCAKSLCNHPRNLTDQQLRALAKHKGVVGVNFYPRFLKETGPVTREDVIRHICHIAEVAGVEAVGLGSDFDGISEVPIGLEHVGDYPYLIEDLIKAGFSAKEVEQIVGRNFMRLLTDVLK
ncbi:dipeptidase [Desulfosporosinus youngiae]|uniref:Zn-dependent dipeptidase, microsomal dipeptidase n=1 Tax=Desulfosporosinus youngiae DSM 17734 TaxID=768710 RepID=H5XWC1_9FIRM|nr:dipeptidase [Desulfosporosinus youngiae]EHQ90290.1 Zn-dependent dipeptidase, microsomal dipeptidase [Desulfosporosinus youngiae DSM 17734]